jgi:integrase
VNSTEMKALVRAAYAGRYPERDVLILHLVQAAGLPPREIVYLRNRHVLKADRPLTAIDLTGIPGQRLCARTVPIAPDGPLFNALLGHFARYKPKDADAPLIRSERATERDGDDPAPAHAMSALSISNRLRTLCRRAELDGITASGERRRFIAGLVRHLPLEQARAISGHRGLDALADQARAEAAAVDQARRRFSDGLL